MSSIFFMSALIWTYILKTSRQPVYRIHIIMCVLVYLKTLSLAFHGINYHFIQTRGEHVTAWAILFYITHLWVFFYLFYITTMYGCKNIYRLVVFTWKLWKYYIICYIILIFTMQPLSTIQSTCRFKIIHNIYLEKSCLVRQIERCSAVRDDSTGRHGLELHKTHSVWSRQEAVHDRHTPAGKHDAFVITKIVEIKQNYVGKKLASL